ncbi:MAG: hypothetical protein V2J02_16005 [Pseudomonadales bacterium]|nr:hypothetical protein [Pseudomonadales bacterium]
MNSGLSVTEHGSLQIADGTGGTLTPREADRLELIGDRRPGFCTRQHEALRFSSYVGLVGLGDRMLEVLPKIESSTASIDECRGVLLRLLRLAPSLRIHSEPPASQAVASGQLLEIMVQAFLAELTALVRGGLLRRYRRESEDLRVVRGRIDLARQARAYALRPDVIACRYELLTADNPWNRALHTALRACRPWVRSVAGRRSWATLAAAFEGIAAPSVSEALRLPPEDRTTDRYRAALRWARWILTCHTPSLRAGDEAAPAMLFDANALFEEAVATTIRRGLAARRSPLELRTQVPDRPLATSEATGRTVVGLRPDLVIERGGRASLVADTKWKVLDVVNGELRPRESDVHQVLAYAVTYRCEEVMLLYPWVPDLGDGQGSAMRLPKVDCFAPCLRIAALDVADDTLRARYGAESCAWQ